MSSSDSPITRILPLNSDRATLSTVGGKGLSLARLTRAGFRVPDGFIVTTHCYESYIADHGLAARLDSELSALKPGNASATEPDPSFLDTVSSAITELFRNRPLADETAREIGAAYRALGSPSAAVRSSATAEDLPELSFAGQQETFLNVVGEEQLLEAVVGCWASLWTARAIGYRHRNDIPHDQIALAVVVQRMIESEASGVMFTANPLTGLRSETIVEATIGLGEALVSGLLEPDRFTVDTRSFTIVDKAIGAKQLSIRSRDGGGTRRITETDRAASAQPAIGDDQAVSLARLGRRVAELYGVPQDIEWTFAGGTLYLLQSRAVTSLYPLPAGMSAEPLQAMFSLAAVQGLMDPLTPLGMDMIRELFAAASHVFGYRYTRDSQRVLAAAGGRLWVDFTPLLRNSVGRRVVLGALAYIEPTVRQALTAVLDDPGLEPQRKGIRLKTLFRLVRFFGPLAANLVGNMIAPTRRRRRLQARAERLLDRIRRASPRNESPLEQLEALVISIDEIYARLIPPHFAPLVSGVATGMVSLSLLNSLARRTEKVDDAPRTGLSDLVLEISRGVPYNPTTEMDLDLWRIASLIRTDAETMRAYDTEGSAVIARRYSAGSLQKKTRQAIAAFLDRYGARGLAEIDTGRPRWRDEPQHIFEIVGAYLGITDPERSPETIFARSAEQAQAAVRRLEHLARTSSSGIRGRARAARVRFAARRAREFLGFREYPKFFFVRVMDIFRGRLKTLGEELAHDGTIEDSDDLFSLTLSELRDFGSAVLTATDARRLVAKRRDDYRRELMRRQIPRLLLSDGRAFYEGISAAPHASGASTDDLSSGLDEWLGSPVSPGSVEGEVRVVLDPRSSGLEPGEIMVCPGTDPSWTPLFLIAGGLIMEVGGMMTHGAVVAREYGIPAVVGVHEATGRLQTGTRIRLDGSSGRITPLDRRP